MARPSGWDILGLDGDPTPGVVDLVQDLAKKFGDFAHDVESAYRSLNSFGADANALEWVGQTAEAFRGQFGPLPGRLQKLYISYSEASDALSAYAPRLQTAQAKADSALRQAQDANVDLQRAQTNASNASADLKTAQQNHAVNPNPQAVTDAQTAHDTAQTNLKSAQDCMKALTAQAHQAHDDLASAAKDCAKALHHAQHDGIHNKHWWEHVGEFLSEWGGKIAEVANEIAPVLDVLAIATSWIPGVDVVTAGLAEADNLIALGGTGLQIAGDTMQGHFGDALMGAGMLGLTFLGGKAISKVGGKAFESLSSKFGKEAEGAENALGRDARNADGNGPAICKDDPVDVVSGWMLADETDVDLPGVLPVVLRRAYSSGYATGRLFGPGWSSTLDQRLSINEAGIHFAGDDSQRLDYPILVNVDEVLPQRGGRWPLVWDRGSDEIRITDPASGLVRHFPVTHFENEFGQIRDLTAISDRNGNRLSILRDDNGTPTMVEHPAYRIAVATVATTAGSRVSELKLLGHGDDSRGVVLKRFSYDERGRLTSVLNSSDLPYSYEWDESDRIIAWRDRSGFRYGYIYDDLGRVIHGESPFLAGSFQYDPANRNTIHTNSLGNVTTYAYDENGHVTSETDPYGHTTVTASDLYGRLLSRTDALGNTTAYEYDDAGDIHRIVAADGLITDLAYDRFHQVLAVTDPDGTQWQRAYDANGNLASVIDPTGAVTSFEHDGSGALTASIDPLGLRTRYVTDAAGLPVEVHDPAGGVTYVVRDGAGRVVRVTDPIGAVTTMEWDLEGLPVARCDPGGAVTRWERDASGELLKITNPVGATTVFEPGPLGILHARTGPDGVRHSFTYDSELNLVAVTYPTGATWTYTYDAVGQLVGETDFNGRTLNYEYDPAGRLAARTTGTGQRITLERDPVGRVIGRNTPEGGYAYRYDRQGRLTTASGPGTVLEYQRDPLGRVVTETVDDRTTRYAYDAVGRLVRRVTASGAESAWNYDDARRSVGLVAGAGGLELSFDAAGQEIRRSLGTDVVLRSQYDAAGRKISQRLMGGGAPDGPGQDVDPPSSSPTLLDRSWTWRADGVPEEVGDGLQGVRRIVSDLAGRPATISGRGWNQSFVYDSFGNRVAITDTSMTAPADAHVATGTLIRRTGRTSYEYDDAGRKVRAIRRTLDGRRKIWTYTWDSQDHLVSADTPDNGTWRYMYDPIGRRTGKHRLTDDGQTADETLFTWDGPCVAEQSTPAPDGTTKIVTWDYEPGTFRPAAQRSRDLDLGIGQDLIDAAFYAMVTDIVGAPTELVAADGRIVWQSTTDLWGRASDDATESAAYCPLRFPGQYLDSETGLHYNLHRYYDPETAAYLTPDPMGLAPSPNDHAYVPNPLIYIDPLGLVGCKGANAVNGAGPVKKGEDGVDMVEADLLADGHVVVGREVHVQMPGTIRGAKGSYRKFDLATIKDDTLIFHEVKNGPRAWYRHRQRDFDDTLMQVGGIPYGPKSGALADQYLSPEEFVINIMRI